MFGVSSNKMALYFTGPRKQHDIISVRRARESAHHAQVKGWCVQGVTSRTSGMLFVTAGEVIQLNYTIDIILSCVFHSLTPRVQRTSPR